MITRTPINPTPCLTRQNAFIVEDNDNITPLDRVCQICNEPKELVPLIQICLCKVQDRPYLISFAHQKCFHDWSLRNDYPKYCSRCNSKYNMRIRKPLSKVLESIQSKLLFALITLVFFLTIYLTIHFYRCTDIEIYMEGEYEAKYPNSGYNDIPDEFFIPTFNLTCFYLSLPTTSIPNFLISSSHCISISITSILLSLFILMKTLA